MIARTCQKGVSHDGTPLRHSEINALQRRIHEPLGIHSAASAYSLIGGQVQIRFRSP